MPPRELPVLPAPLAELPAYLATHPDKPATELFAPYREYEAGIRERFAQEPGHPALKDPHVNVLPVFTEATPAVTVRARDLAAESAAEKSRYIMPLPDDNRRPNGAAAVVPSLKMFQDHFAVFSESALAAVNWDNVVAAGSSVVSCLLPVPDKYRASKRGLREYYHEKLCPASDVDLFLYGLTEEQAIEKIRQIETSVRDSILAETTTVRTKHAITICSEYPTRHIQIVLRIYKSVSEILTGFDVDCSGAAYDGKQVYCTPRALQSYVTQVNHVDLSRRSPSYENRLSKYSHRNFEIYCAELDRSRVDPTIFDRSFHRTLGLARLLVLELLPTSDSRESYAAQRRSERGRPPLDNRSAQRAPSSLRGNIKDKFEDEVAEWVSQDDVSNYNTFVLPYGRYYHAKRIEKLCYTRDLLLNAEWNQKKDRDVYLHRHPAFFGTFDDVINDCCGFCPTPVSAREKEIAEEESKIYVSGKISFLTDDPGRQQIGSFNPLTDDDWTEMAYVGNTARLCQAIVDGDLDHVEDWLSQDGVDPNRRDHTGRTPLHLAVISSTPAIVKCLVENGARLVARVADGRTALHLAAQRGDIEIVKILLNKSTANEAEEFEKEDQKRRTEARAAGRKIIDRDREDEDEEDEDDGELVDAKSSTDFGHSTTTASFVKVRRGNDDRQDAAADVSLEENEKELDFYDINVVAWDRPCSALHFAIMEGHDEVVKLLCQEYGADVLLPVKVPRFRFSPAVAHLTLVLASTLPVDKAKTMVGTLLSLGATSSQADLNGFTAFHQYVERNAEELVDVLLELDKTGSSTAMKHVAFPPALVTESPLLAAISQGNVKLARKLLDAGTLPEIDFDVWLKAAKACLQFSYRLGTLENNMKLYRQYAEQPLIKALLSPNPSIALDLLKYGADPDTPTTKAVINNPRTVVSRNPKMSFCALDIVRSNLKNLRDYNGEKPAVKKPQDVALSMEIFLARLPEDSWMHFAATQDAKKTKDLYEKEMHAYNEEVKRLATMEGLDEKKAAIAEMIRIHEAMEAKIIKASKKTTKLQEEAPTHQLPDRTAGYRFVPQFSGSTDVTESRRYGYVQLFEAAWLGDLRTIKSLTLAAWGDEKKEAPLNIAVQDNDGNHPFSLAFLRGHYKVAAAILEITQAQYAPEDGPKVRYEMIDDVYDGSDDDDDSSDDGRGLYRRIVDDEQFTIDNIGEINMRVQGKTTPLDVLAWSSPTFVVQDGKAEKYESKPESLFEFVLKKGDQRGLKFLLDSGTYFSAQKAFGGKEDAGSRFFTLPVKDFLAAVAVGRTEMLAEIIKHTGAGLPLEEMVKNSGVQMLTKPRYYQGLTVHGKKRKDWAEAGRHTVWRPAGTQTSPLLHAARAGCLESVEWFLSDAPLRCYLEFTRSELARDDARVQHLSRAPGGFEGAITRWLQKDSDLALLAAVACPAYEKVLPLVQYLSKVMPQCISAANAVGYTPLFMAALAGRVDVVRFLIHDCDADPARRRNGTYENLLHAALRFNPSAEQLRQFLDVLPPDARTRMFCERSHHTSESRGRTPLHHWLQQCVMHATPDLSHTFRCEPPSWAYQTISAALDVLRLLLAYSGGRELLQLDRAGDTVLHTLVAHEGLPPPFLHALLAAADAQQPGLSARMLYRENAVGVTPIELAREQFVGAVVHPRPERGLWLRYRPSMADWPKLPAEEFRAATTTAPPNAVVGEKDNNDDDDDDDDEKWTPIPNRVYGPVPHMLHRIQAVRAALEKHLAKLAAAGADGAQRPRRRLVSLNEANDVAQRLGDGLQKDRYLAAVASHDDGDDDGNHASDGDRSKTLQAFMAVSPPELTKTAWWHEERD
ncbi:Ankyrin repeat-containing domain protein [Niveomyces insectorum RCEF 264]|uniref:Ankyrin repeat-containing domain protein n=1 Tax=Niveomyces insectorum RCEF 264 TaxID=1081102 RepID=A0A167VJS5_9HYPO|nr:Ankyrin repeat-containing domain protein [Niveomyces insectorum RCEF 264]